MPEVTEIVEKDSAVESGSDSEDNDSIPDLDEVTGDGGTETAVAAPAGEIGEEGAKGKQSRGEKKEIKAGHRCVQGNHQKV